MAAAIILRGSSYPYELIRSRRKSLAIQIKPDGAIVVRAPLWVSPQEIEGFLRQKEDWIIKTRARVAADRIDHQMNPDRMPAGSAAGPNALLPVNALTNGSRLNYRGKEYRLEINVNESSNVARGRVSVRMDDQKIILTAAMDLTAAMVRAVLESWYREQARQILSAKAEQFAAVLGVVYHNIRIKDQKSRWGSCSTKSNLNFNWRIIMAPDFIADYLVIHELCHLRHMNHSPAFWDLVGSICPGRHEAQKWLRRQENNLMAW